MELYLSNER
jgi:hypothetical protein